MINGLVKQTAAHREEYVVYLSKKPLPVLREMLAIVKGKQRFNYSQYLKALKSRRYDDQKRLERVSAELLKQEEALEKALGRK